MNLNLSQNLPAGPLRRQFQDLTSQITAGWDREHLPDGTHGLITTTESIVAGGTGTFLSQPRFLLYLPAAGVSCPPSVQVTLPWADPGTRSFESPTGLLTSGYMSPGWQFVTGATTHVIVPQDGLYFIRVAGRWLDISTGYGYMDLYWNGNRILQTYTRIEPADYPLLTISTIWPCRTGDVLFVQILQTGPTQTFSAEPHLSSFTMVKLG